MDVIVQIILGYLIADFLIGGFHWLKDTYFNPLTPIIGKRLIWGSRLHHIKPRHVLTFSNYELIKDSALWTALWMVPIMFFITGWHPSMISMYIFISLNEVIHKYAHMNPNEVHSFILWLQDLRIIQSADEHHLHHTDTNEAYYCPISPYMNTILESVQFWRRLEDFIAYATGIQPRVMNYHAIDNPNYPAEIEFVMN